METNDYLLRVTDVVRRWVPSIDSVEAGLALHYLLMLRSIALQDGFVINDPRDQSTIIGQREGIDILAALDPGRRSAEWWNGQRFAPVDESRVDRERAALEVRIAADPEVKSVE